MLPERERAFEAKLILFNFIKGRFPAFKWQQEEPGISLHQRQRGRAHGPKGREHMECVTHVCH